MRFAHLSDIHLGFQKHEALQKVEQQVFEKIFDECISRKVDFILIPGDLFHVNIPEMRVQKFAFAKFRQIYDAGIPVYVVYGSHDFSPVSNSVIDLLAEVGYITKVTRATSLENNKIKLGFLLDKKTGVKIAGLSGLKVGKDREYYEKLDSESLEAEPGFKIFLFHGGISEMKTDSGMDGENMPLSLLPRNFDYYAGGHMHKFNAQKFENYENIVYSGTPFAGYHTDLEENAKGQKRGFVLVEFEEKIKNIEFVEIGNTNYKIIEINAENRIAESVNKELQDKIRAIDPAQQVVIIKVRGEMTKGKTADVDVSTIRDELNQKGALVVNINKNQLSSKEYSITEAKGANREEIITNVFAENIGQLRFEQKNLIGEQGIQLAKKLLAGLVLQKLENEKSADYISRIKENAFGILGVDTNNS
ncbi:MAG: DNA repair exonuclease [Nitrosarchaeum sp.]|nr:DNA repair exonuclease [Nitrosarchaeum sp.]